MLMLLKHGPSTASELAGRLDMSAAGVRRHLDILVAEGLGEAVDRRPRSATATRGRPAKAFRLTPRGRSIFGHSYDQLAVDALETLRETGGEEAVRKLARKRIQRIVEGVTPADGDENSIQRTAGELADAFDRHGYAATVTRAGAGIQICQHHCPVANVAAEHPELCEAEHEIISNLVGLHVQPLATITGGHGICTTNIPLTPIENLPEERSGS
ncbi:transcriptional regulator [Corynebacterium hylobatis]|uniref:Transcriptional regulator n=2 Tax=Corynebacterium hylobatis TaxID=1859290 RepID=A0A430HYG6_9CORY|nr:transcriptional regulator [Corynebacterium hylobatis]